MENKVAVIETTCAGAESAKLIAETLVFERVCGMRANRISDNVNI